MSVDLWRSGFVRRALRDIATSGVIRGDEVIWLPEAGPFRFHADPFGIETPKGLTILAEGFDYRTKCGQIDYFTYDEENRLIERGIALLKPFHLSYPFVWQAGDDIYLLPEACANGGLDLYRANAFPTGWERISRLIEGPVVDASLIFHQGLWWMFHALEGPQRRAMRELHIAWADQLTGPWHAHGLSPARTGLMDCRPGGTPFVEGSRLFIPMQDCRQTYGGGIVIMEVSELTPDRFSAAPARDIGPQGLVPGYVDGFHTLSGTEAFTCFDVKRVHSSALEPLIGIERHIRRAWRRR